MRFRMFFASRGKCMGAARTHEIGCDSMWWYYDSQASNAGYVFNKTRTHSSASLTEDEKTVLQQYIGEIEQVGFSELANSHEMLIPYREYVE